MQFDLSNFYDCVRLDTLERSIREEAPSEKGWIITLLFYLLNHWNRKNTGLHPQAVGLPQDVLADCSRILSNYYLQKYDRFAASVCAGSGAVYFRYADDTMILLNDQTKVESLLLLLTRRLDRIGLRVNQKKVHIWDSDSLQEHRCRAIQSIFAHKGDNQVDFLVRRFVDAYFDMPEDSLKRTWNQGLPLLNRLLWANLESLPNRIFNRVVVRFTSDQFLICADSKKMKRIHELNLKRPHPINFVRLLERLADKCVHNAFHHEVFAFATAIKHQDLMGLMDSRLTAIDNLMNAQEIR